MSSAIFSSGASAGQTFWTLKQDHHGWFAGGGIEYAYSPNWIAGIEAAYVDLGDRTGVPSTPAGVPVNGDRHNVDTHFVMVRAR